MNAVVDAWVELDSHWNVQLIMYSAENSPRTDLTDRLVRTRDDLYHGAAVLHFAGVHKPWNPWAVTPGAMLWASEMIRSGWYRPLEAGRWVVPWMIGRTAIAAGRRVASYAPPAFGDAGRRAANRMRSRGRRR